MPLLPASDFRCAIPPRQRLNRRSDDSPKFGTAVRAANMAPRYSQRRLFYCKFLSWPPHCSVRPKSTWKRDSRSAQEKVPIEEIVRRLGHSRQLARRVIRGKRQDIFRTWHSSRLFQRQYPPNYPLGHRRSVLLV